MYLFTGCVYIMAMAGLEKDMFKLNGKPLGINNFVIEVDPHIKVKDKTLHEYITFSKDFLAVIDHRGIYLVRPKFIEKLKNDNIRYLIIARYPMPKEVRQQIRKITKKEGITTPI